VRAGGNACLNLLPKLGRFKFIIVFSIQRLFGNEDQFFNLLEASAEEARTSVQALVKFSQSSDRAKLLPEFMESLKKEKQIRKQISTTLYKTFVTVLEREDIENLSHALCRIPKTVEKFAERLLMTPAYVQGVDFSKQVRLLELATEDILVMVRALHAGAKLEEITPMQEKLQYYEGEADKAMLGLLQELLNAERDSVRIVVLKDLYELLEKAIDRCRDVGNIITKIALKNS
jgi:uncharacterized protein